MYSYMKLLCSAKLIKGDRMISKKFLKRTRKALVPLLLVFTDTNCALSDSILAQENETNRSTR